MAVTFLSGPMNTHRPDVNQESGRPHQRAQAKHCINPGKKTHSKMSPSTDYVARIVRSTAELSESIKYLTYVIAFSTSGSSESKSTKASKSSARSIEKTSIPARKSSTLTRASKRTNSVKLQADSTMGRQSKDEPASASTYTPSDPFKDNVLYPVFRGTLRQPYVQELEKRLTEERNRDEGWHRGRLSQWFGAHLDLEVHQSATRADFKSHLRAAVELHKRMSMNSTIKQRDGVPEEADDLWRDVVDQLNPGIFVGKPVLKHITGRDGSKYEHFLAAWDKIVDEEKWDSKTLVMFYSPSAPRWNQQRRI